MNERNQNLAVSIETFLMEFTEDVVRGLQEYFIANKAALSIETI